MIVAGAGAAGLAAAAEAARAGARVVLLEKNAKPGLKILISGGGHCNVTTSLGVREAERAFGPGGGRFLRHAIRRTTPAVIRGWLEERGVATFEAEFEKVWPCSRRASDVLDALLRRAADAGAELRTEAGVRSIRKSGRGWIAETTRGEVRGDRLVLAVGGRSYPKTGTVGEGYRWLADLGVAVHDQVPALAPLASPAAWVRELTGVSLPGAEILLLAPDGSVAYRRQRPILFTHHGISGPGPMDVSSRLERAPGRYRVVIDLCPERSREELAALFEGSGTLVRQLQRRLELPRRLVARVVASAGLTDVPPAQVPRSERRALVDRLKRLEVPVSGSLGYAKAELTAGGVDLGEVEPRTMEVKRCPGLYVTGELLDVDGPIGGFSFLVAFATGALAGVSAAGQALPLAQPDAP